MTDHSSSSSSSPLPPLTGRMSSSSVTPECEGEKSIAGASAVATTVTNGTFAINETGYASALKHLRLSSKEDRDLESDQLLSNQDTLSPVLDQTEKDSKYLSWRPCQRASLKGKSDEFSSSLSSSSSSIKNTSFTSFTIDGYPCIDVKDENDSKKGPQATVHMESTVGSIFPTLSSTEAIVGQVSRPLPFILSSEVQQWLDELQEDIDNCRNCEFDYEIDEERLRHRWRSLFTGLDWLWDDDEENNDMSFREDERIDLLLSLSEPVYRRYPRGAFRHFPPQLTLAAVRRFLDVKEENLDDTCDHGWLADACSNLRDAQTLLDIIQRFCSSSSPQLDSAADVSMDVLMRMLLQEEIEDGNQRDIEAGVLTSLILERCSDSGFVDELLRRMVVMVGLPPEDGQIDINTNSQGLLALAEKMLLFVAQVGLVHAQDLDSAIQFLMALYRTRSDDHRIVVAVLKCLGGLLVRQSPPLVKRPDSETTRLILETLAERHEEPVVLSSFVTFTSQKPDDDDDDAEGGPASYIKVVGMDRLLAFLRNSDNKRNGQHIDAHRIIANVVETLGKIQKDEGEGDVDVLDATVQVLLQSLEAHSDNADIQEAVLSSLCCLSDRVVPLLAQRRGVGHVHQAMMVHTDIATIQEHGCALLLELSLLHKRKEGQGDRVDVADMGGLECVMVAAAKHSDRCSLQVVVNRLFLELYRSGNSLAAHENYRATIRNLSMGSRLNFPGECGETVDEIITILDKFNATPLPSNEMRSLRCDGRAQKHDAVFHQPALTDFSHRVIFLGATDLERREVIHQIVNYDASKLYYGNKRCTKTIGVVDYHWYPLGNSREEKGKDFKLEILDCSERVLPGIFFSTQATYIVVWDMNKSFPAETVVDDDVNNIYFFDADKERRQAWAVADIDREVLDLVNFVDAEIHGARIVVAGICRRRHPSDLSVPVGKDDPLEQERERKQYEIMKQRFEELCFTRMMSLSKSGQNPQIGSRRPNLFTGEERAGIIFYFGEKVSNSNTKLNAAMALRNMILQTALNSQEVDVFLADASTRAQAAQIVGRIKDLGRTQALMQWSNFLRLVHEMLQHNRHDESSIDVALHVMFASGAIRSFQSPPEGWSPMIHDGNSRNLEELVVLNNEWLVSVVRCIMVDGYDSLRLSIREIKEDLDFDDEGFYNIEDQFVHNFCEVCLNCPVITRKDSELLWWNTQSVSRCVHDNDASVALRCLENICVKVGLLVPLQPHLERSHIFFVPSLLEMLTDEEGDPPRWSFKHKDSRKHVVSGTYTFREGISRNFMKDVTAEVLRKLYANIKDGRKQRSDCDSVRWLVLNDDCVTPSLHERYKYDLIIHEICCWQSAVLVKVECRSNENCDCESNTFMEALIHSADKDSPLCLSANTLDFGKQRISVTWKGLKNDAKKCGKILYQTLINVMEKVLTSTNASFSREIPCPYCLQNIPLCEVCLFDTQVMSRRNSGIDKCAKGHSIKSFMT